MDNNPDQILSSSVSILLDNKHWFRQTEGKNITWIPMCSDFYFSYREVDKRWWFCDDNRKFKLDDAPEIEAKYQSFLSFSKEEKKKTDFEVVKETYKRKISNVWYFNFACRFKDCYWTRHSEIVNDETYFIRWHSPDTEKEYFFGLNDKFKDSWQFKNSPEGQWFDILDTPEIEQKYQEMLKNATPTT